MQTSIPLSLQKVMREASPKSVDKLEHRKGSPEEEIEYYTDRYGIDKEVFKELEKGRIQARDSVENVKEKWGNELYEEEKYGGSIFQALQQYSAQLDAENLVWMLQLSHLADSKINKNKLTVGQLLDITTNYFEDEFVSSERAIATVAVKFPFFRVAYEGADGIDTDKMNANLGSVHEYDVVHGHSVGGNKPKPHIPENELLRKLNEDVMTGLTNGRKRARTMADIVRKHWANEYYIEEKHGKAVFSVFQMYLRQLDAENLVWMQQISSMASQYQNTNLTVGQFLEIVTDYFEKEFRTSEKAITILAMRQPVYRDLTMNKTTNTLNMDSFSARWKSDDHTYDVLHGYVDDRLVRRAKEIEDHIQEVIKLRAEQGYIRKDPKIYDKSIEVDKTPNKFTTVPLSKISVIENGKDVEKVPKKNTTITSSPVKENPVIEEDKVVVKVPQKSTTITLSHDNKDLESKEVDEELQEVKMEYKELSDIKFNFDSFKPNTIENQELNIANPSVQSPLSNQISGDNSNNDLKSWEIALISVGSVAFLMALCFLTYICVRKFCIRNNNSHKTEHNGVKGVDAESFGHERIADSNLGRNNLVDVAMSNNPASTHKYSVFTSNV